MAKRSIRLKELGVNVNRVVTPSGDYLKNCPKLNRSEMYQLITNDEGNQIGVLDYVSKNKIYLLGGSTVEAMYMKQSLRPHNILERKLLESGYDYEVHNLGSSGCQLFNIINLIVNKLSNKKNSIVVLTLPSNDIGPLRYLDGYFNKHKFHATIMPASELKVKANKDMDLSLYSKMLDTIVALCEIFGLKLYFTSICYTTPVKELKILNDFSREYCQRKNVNYIDMESDQYNSKDFFYDKLHFLPNGSKHFSNSIYEALKVDIRAISACKVKCFEFPFFSEYQKNIIWSDFFDISSSVKIKLIVDLETFDDIKSPLLYAVDYDCDPVTTNLIKSNNIDIGFFKYIEGFKNKRIEVVTDIFIPVNCKRIKVGLRSWTNKKFVVHSSQLIILHS